MNWFFKMFKKDKFRCDGKSARWVTKGGYRFCSVCNSLDVESFRRICIKSIVDGEDTHFSQAFSVARIMDGYIIRLPYINATENYFFRDKHMPGGLESEYNLMRLIVRALSLSEERMKSSIHKEKYGG